MYVPTTQPKQTQNNPKQETDSSLMAGATNDWNPL